MSNETTREINKAINMLNSAKSDIRRGYFGFAIGNDLPDAMRLIAKAILMGEREFELVVSVQDKNQV